LINIHDLSVGMAWEVIVEPDFDARLLVVVTAYAVWEA